MSKTRKEIAEEAIKRYLNEPIKNITQAYYDDFVKENARNSAQVGLKAMVIRREVGKCCSWCASLAGEYEYGEQPADFFRRHDYCKCMVLFRSVKGKYTDVWNKKEFETEKAARIEKLRQFELEDEFAQMSRITLKPYWDNATPRKGKIEIEKGWDKGQNGDAELRYAKNLHQRFGGNIVIQAKRNDMRFSDYKWNGKLWEHKSVHGINSIDKQVQHGIHQISSNPGGLILERKSNISKQEMYDVIMNRLRRTTPMNIQEMDVLVFDGDNIFLAIHYKK